MDLFLSILVELAMTVLLFGVASLASSWALLKGFKPRTVVLAGSATIALFFAAIFLLAPWGQEDFHSQFKKYFDDYWNLQSRKMGEKGMSAENIALSKDFFQNYIYQAFPAWLAVNSLTIGLAAYYIVSAILSRVTLRVPRPLAFRQWVIPEPMVFGLIVGGAFKLFGSAGLWMDVLGNNFVVFFMALYALGGLSIISFFFNKWRMPALVRVPAYLFLAAVAFTTVCALGVLDVWFDFRKLKTAPPEPTP